MAKRKSRKKKKNPGIFSKIVGLFVDERFAPLRKMVVVVVPLSIFLVGVVMGMGHLESYVKNVAANRDIKLELVFVGDKPGWATDQLLEKVNLSTGISSDDYLLDDALIKTAWKNLQENPWVASVNLVRKCYSGEIMVDYTLREPVAEIIRGNDIRYIDVNGVVLDYAPVQKHMVKVEGSYQAVPKPGLVIKQEDVCAALDILSKIKLVDESMDDADTIWPEISYIDVSNYNGRENPNVSHINLYTHKNTQIRWGAAVGREKAYWEADTPTKLARLYRDYRDYGTLDISSSGIELRDHQQ